MQKKDNGPTQRQLRVGEVVKKALSAIFTKGDFINPALSNIIITISQVKMTPDLKTAIVYFVALGGGENKLILEALNEEVFNLRMRLSSEVYLKYSPQLLFKVDESFAKAQQMEQLLKGI